MQRPTILDATSENEFIITSIIDGSGATARLGFNRVNARGPDNDMIDVPAVAGETVKGNKTLRSEAIQDFVDFLIRLFACSDVA